jgi:hypothetical protein
MTETAIPATSDYPARLSIEAQTSLSRASTIFRIILIIPIAIVLHLLVSSGEGAIVVVNEAGDVASTSTSYGFGILGTLFFLTLLMILFRKVYPRWWFDFALNLHRFITRVTAYFLLLTDRYPSTEDHQNVHLDLDYPDARTQLNRGLPLVKWFLAIPHFVVLFFLGIAVFVVVVLSWFAIIFTGRYPTAFFDFVVGYLRWSWRVQAYAILLATDKYPPFSLR